MTKGYRARRLVLQGLCCLDLQGSKALESVEEFIEDSRENSNITKAARQLLQKAFIDRDKCDCLLIRHARHWELARLAMVDRNILRMAVCELRAGNIGEKIVISEALKLAEEFSTAESPRFINGVLDAAAREISKAADAENRCEGEQGNGKVQGNKDNGDIS